MSTINGMPNFFEKTSNERALQTPFGKDSLLYTELEGDFFEGYVPFIPILWRLGAPMPGKEEKTGKGPKLQEVIIKAEKKVEQKIFDYKKYSELKQEGENYWEYHENNFAGQAILNKKMGYIDPEKLFFDKDRAGYNIYIPYKDDDKVSANNPNIEYLKANAIIKLTQLDQDAFITILSNLSNSKRKIYVNNILKGIVKEIEALLQNSKNIEKLFDIPIDLLRQFKQETLQKIFNEFLKSGTIPWFREAILINILKVLPEKEKFNATTFLNSLVKPLDNGGNYFYKLYNRMNDWGGENNFSQLIIELTKIWSESVYSNPFFEMFNKYDALAPIAYNQNYILGFRNDNFDFEFESTALKVMHNDLNIPIAGTVRYQKHHIFQPLEVADLKETEAENLKLSEGVKLPAFYLKAFDDKSAWENFEKGVWLGVDIVSTATGIGNLTKLRHLIKVEKTAYVVLKTTFGVIQVASGTISIGLSLIENKDNKDLVNKIREYLFWLEICTLGADVLSTKILSKKAKEAQEVLEIYRETLKNEKELKQIDEFSEHLDEAIESERKLINKWDNGQLLSERTLRKRVKNLLHDYKNFKLEVHFVDEVKDAERIADWNARNVLGSFNMGPPPKLYFRKQVTQLTWQHEIWHLEDLKKMGSKLFYNTTNWEKEELVWERIWKTKERWTEEELVDSYRYYLKSCDKENIEPKLIKELEELLEKPYYRNVRYKR